MRLRKKTDITKRNRLNFIYPQWGERFDHPHGTERSIFLLKVKINPSLVKNLTDLWKEITMKYQTFSPLCRRRSLNILQGVRGTDTLSQHLSAPAFIRTAAAASGTNTPVLSRLQVHPPLSSAGRRVRVVITRHYSVG